MRLSVKNKIRLASAASRVVIGGYALVGRGPVGEFKRSGLNWLLDLREGIDFAIWLLGGYEPELSKFYERIIPTGATVLDVGANIGAHTLRLARSVGPAGKVHAFEPTGFAMEKLKRNLALNSDLASIVDVHHIFLGHKDSGGAPPEICASWPLGAKGSDEELSDFCGLPRSTDGARSMTLDSFAEHAKLERVDFVKLDVDGHEAQVLAGAVKVIERFRPDFVTEFAPFVPQASGWSFQELVSFFLDRGYGFYDIETCGDLPGSADELSQRIPSGAGLNVFARHRSKNSPLRKLSTVRCKQPH